MIEQTLNKFKKIIGVEPNHKWEENVLTHNPKVQSTVDEGKHLTNIERQVHIYNEIKKK